MQNHKNYLETVQRNVKFWLQRKHKTNSRPFGVQRHKVLSVELVVRKNPFHEGITDTEQDSKERHDTITGEEIGAATRGLHLSNCTTGQTNNQRALLANL